MAAPSFFGVKDDFLTPNGPHIGRQWEGNLPSLWDFFFQSLTGSMILSGLGGGALKIFGGVWRHHPTFRGAGTCRIQATSVGFGEAGPQVLN